MRLSVNGLTKAYGRLRALDDVSLTVRQGEILGLIGPNGAGKTTLFECLAGLLPTDRGSVALDGRTIAVDERCTHLFYLADGIAPWPAQTVGWALDYTIRFFDSAASLKDEVVARLDLGALLGATVGTLSKGQRKRLTLGIGLLTPQPFLLIDEPFDGLDLRQSRDVAEALRAHAAGGRTLFLSIHQIRDAARICHRFVLLSNGHVRGQGTLDELSALAAAHGAPAQGDLEEVFLALT